MVKRLLMLFSVILAVAALALIFIARPANEESPSAIDGGIDWVERQLETESHERLLARIRGRSAELSAFTTDGCSGGLSAGWTLLSEALPEFESRHGALPPWQQCCVAHDRRYHEASDPDSDIDTSFMARRRADIELHACVIQTGERRSGELRQEYGFTETQVAALYRTIADAMYRAVRLGGMPCTGLPWRWGYGWPPCE